MVHGSKKVTLLHIVITTLISAITAVSISLTSFSHYIAKSTIINHITLQNQEDIVQVKKDITEHIKEFNELHADYGHLLDADQTQDLKINTVRTHLLNTVSYQQVLRREVQSNAENKVNTTDFWRILDKLMLRMRWLEDHHKLMNCQS